MTLNSINVARVLVQTVLYIWAYFKGRRSSEEEVEVIVPTGAAGSATGRGPGQKVLEGREGLGIRELDLMPCIS